jgi:thiamine monophosphate synthase
VRQADIELCVAHQQLTIPVVAIGVINAENGAAALAAGADMLSTPCKHNHDHQLSRDEASNKQ